MFCYDLFYSKLKKPEVNKSVRPLTLNKQNIQ